MNRRDFLAAVGACAAGALNARPVSHHFVEDEPAPNSPAPTTSGSARIVSGRGEFRYEYVPDRLSLPPAVKMKHGHGLCHDKSGNIYFTFEPETVDEQTRALVRFEPDGTGAVLLGSSNVLAHGTPHGLNIHHEQGGRPVLYHANNDATVHKTTLEGEILWSQKWSPQMGNYRPTDAVVPYSQERVLVADGYGSSMIHALRAVDGVYAGKSWGGLGAEHGELNCPHGITFDPRRELLLTADRGNRRLEYFTLNGKYHGTIEAPEIAAPCNADIRGDYVLVPDLNGPVVILDQDNRVISVIDQAKFLGGSGFKHPHDAIWLPNGDIVVCTWNPGKIAYWRRSE